MPTISVGPEELRDGGPRLTRMFSVSFSAAIVGGGGHRRAPYEISEHEQVGHECAGRLTFVLQGLHLTTRCSNSTARS